MCYWWRLEICHTLLLLEVIFQKQYIYFFDVKKEFYWKQLLSGTLTNVFYEWKHYVAIEVAGSFNIFLIY